MICFGIEKAPLAFVPRCDLKKEVKSAAFVKRFDTLTYNSCEIYPCLIKVYTHK